MLAPGKPAAIAHVYPADAYIAERGYGQTREAAETAAATAVARYFSSQIRSSVSERATETRQDGIASQSYEAEIASYVTSELSIAGLRYAPDAFYNKAASQWETVAYIDRAEAWALYEPRFARLIAAFRALYQAAEAEGDPFKKALRLGAARAYAQGADFEAAESFGQILHPAKMNAAFSAVRGDIASLPQKTDAARRNATVYIDCPTDFESLVANAFSRALIAEGFPVAKARAEAAVVCAVTVDEGMQQRELGVFYFPSLQAVFTGSSGALFTYNASAERASAVTPDVAKRRAYSGLAEQVRETFAAELNASLGK
jgi:hypothetical protein